MDKQLRKRVSLTNPDHFFGLGFGTGLIPLMPGTFGSLAAIPLLLAMSFLPFWGYIAVTFACTLIGLRFCQKTSDALGLHDHGAIVWDEIAGMMFVFIAVPINPITLVIGFILFRFFDILKPWPIRVFDRKIHGGLGIMLDDIVAGAMACLCLHLMVYMQWLVL
ncbi:phosphatidylglycerophosphatase A [Glaciecola sp. SC05]|uniref:phosphatidylglycerophosphatase A family protein n=1 Tax=Glaciecola sp. SC05 TaxID=1987355 RepID=UPI0035284613